MVLLLRRRPSLSQLGQDLLAMLVERRRGRARRSTGERGQARHLRHRHAAEPRLLDPGHRADLLHVRIVGLIQPSLALKVPDGVRPGWGLPPSRWCWIIDTAWIVAPPRSRLDSM